MNPAHWPYNAQSQRADKGPIQWREAAFPMEVTPAMLHAVPIKEWSVLKTAVYGDVWSGLDADTQELITEHVEGRSVIAAEVLTPMTVTSMAQRAMEIENARAAIPVESLIKTMLDGIETGFMGGQPLATKDRVDMAKFLVNKSLPDAKGIDMDERGRDFDRKKRRAKDYASEELKKLTKEELLDLIDS